MTGMLPPCPPVGGKDLHGRYRPNGSLGKMTFPQFEALQAVRPQPRGDPVGEGGKRGALSILLDEIALCRVVTMRRRCCEVLEVLEAGFRRWKDG